ncbi:MAG: hypothetical protein KF819_10790 [Labilithrix sp.]|nr:hypothetical protein [Labilithrix sp.]
MKTTSKTTGALLFSLFAVLAAGCEDASNSGGAVDVPAPGETPPGETPVVIKCDPPTGGPTKHDASRVTADETWTAAGSPHIVTGTVGVSSGAKLTIEPCAEVRMGRDAALLVSGPQSPTTGSLVAEGDAEHPIKIVADDPAKPWANLALRAGATASLAHVTLEGGGAGNGPFSDAILRVTGDQYQDPQQMLKAKNVTVKGSKNYGVFLEGHGTFTQDSDALTVTGSTKAPIATWASSIGHLPHGTYTGNGVDHVVIRGGGGYERIDTSVTLKNLGVSYHVGTEQTNAPLIHVSGGAKGLATLTIEKGTRVAFGAGGIFEIEHFTGDAPATGALVAAGTPDAKIVFTSAAATPAAGDWVGLHYGMVPSATNKLDHVVVEYAGGTTGTLNFSCNEPYRDEAAILVLGEPSGAFVTNTAIKHSARHGIDRGWRGAPIDFMASNTFDGVAACKQTFPKDDNGGCPASPACP